MSKFKVGDKVRVCEDSPFSFRGKIVEIAEDMGLICTFVKTEEGKYCVQNRELEFVNVENLDPQIKKLVDTGKVNLEDVPKFTLINRNASKIESHIEAFEEGETVTPIKHLTNPNLLTCAGFNYRLGLNGDNL